MSENLLSSVKNKFHLTSILLLTVILLTAVFAVRTAALLILYPQVKIPIAEVIGENGENLSDLAAGDNKLTAASTRPVIAFSYTGGVPVRSVTIQISDLSRNNCYTYVILKNCSEESQAAAVTEAGQKTAVTRMGSTLLKAGKNNIDIDGAGRDTIPETIQWKPVSVQGVSFRLLSFTINSRSHTILCQLRTYLLLLMVFLFPEGLAAEMLAQRRRTGRPRLAGCILLPALQAGLGLLLIYLNYTANWINAAMIYHFAAFGSCGLFLLLLYRPDLSSGKAAGIISACVSRCRQKGQALTGRLFRRSKKAEKAAPSGQREAEAPQGGRQEFPVIRILLLAVFDFSILEMLYGDMFRLDNTDAIFMNLLVYAVPYLALYALLGRHRRTVYTLPTIFWFLLALINHYYFVYREQAIELADFLLAGTAKNVIGNYSLPVSADLVFALTAFLLLLPGMVLEKPSVLCRKGWKRRTAAAAAAAAAVLYIGCNLLNVNLWNTNMATLHHGYAYTWFSFAKKTLTKPTPEGYSAEETEAFLDGYVQSDKGAGTDTSSGQLPNIIVVMDEAFADLPSTYDFETDVDDLPYIHSLSGSNVRKGWIQTSVFGGTTANTEYEFLTGNSVAFLGADSVPYTQYINSAQQSLARLLKSRGYSATALHPYLASGYGRYKVYPLLGFDTFYSQESGLKYTQKMRSYTDDSSDFKDLIQIFEEQEEAGPVFLFNVTMQNHGDYSKDLPAVDVTVKPVDPDLCLPQLEEYLSLAHATDAAFEELTDYFSGIDEPTIILMFGDHQPGLAESTMRAIEPELYDENASLAEKEKKYTVPYIIWANFDLPEDDLPETTSPNYLRTYLLKCAGVTGSAYDAMTAEVSEEYPAINILGYLDADGNWNELSSLDSAAELVNYKKAAYYNLFDHSHVEMSYFTDP